jgi:hypothetical protein
MADILQSSVMASGQRAPYRAAMARRAIRFAGLIACLLAAWQPLMAQAQEEDVQFWLSPTASAEIARDTRLTIDGSIRFRDQTSGGEQLTARVTLDRSVHESLRLGGGIGVFEAEGGKTELRAHQQATVRFGPIAARTRFEQRAFDEAERVELRLRQRLHYIWAPAHRLEARMGGEWLGFVQTRASGRPGGTDQWRAQVELSWQASSGLAVGARYWLIVAPRGALADRTSHVPQVTLDLAF